MGQAHAHFGIVAIGRALPDDLVEALVAPAVDVVLARVGCDRIVAAVQREAGAGDAIGVASDHRAEEGVAPDVRIEIIESQRDVGRLALAVGRFERDQDRPIFDNPCPQSTGVRQRVEGHVPTVGHRPERTLGDRGFGLCPGNAQRGCQREHEARQQQEGWDLSRGHGSSLLWGYMRSVSMAQQRPRLPTSAPF